MGTEMTSLVRLTPRISLEQNIQDGKFNDSLSSGEANYQGISKRICPPAARPFRRNWERSKNLFCSGVFLKGSAFAVGLWNPKKGFRSVMIAFIIVLDLFYLLAGVYYTFVCRRFDTPLNSWFCGNSSSNSSSLRSSSPKGALQGVELRFVLSLVANFAVLVSNVAFFWCMWKLGDRSVYCATMDKAYSAAKRSNWVALKLGRANLLCSALVSCCHCCSYFFFPTSFHFSSMPLTGFSFISPSWRV